MKRFIALASATAAIVLALPASAATVTRQMINLSAKGCQAALPAFDGQIRKRPLALQNEGTADAFVTCAFEGVFGGITPYNTTIGMVLRNNGNTIATVDCTLVDGRTNLAMPLYFTKTVNLAANAVAVDLVFSSADNGGVGFIYPAVSCRLPPSTGIAATAQIFAEEIGN